MKIEKINHRDLITEFCKRLKKGEYDEDYLEGLLLILSEKKWVILPEDEKEAELGDFEFSEILEYLGEQLDDIETSDFDGLLRLLETVNAGPITISGLYDKMKFEHICKVFEKYTLEQFETLLPE